MKLPRRQFLQLAAGAAALPAASRVARAQAYPSRPVTMIVPFPAGGATTTLARILAEHMKTTLGQPIVVENVGGASGSIGTTRVARAVPDGYTLSFGNWASHVGSGAMIPLQFDLLKDLEPVAFLANSPLWVVANKDLTPRDLKEFIAWLKADPDKATAATVGVGSGSHMCGIYIQNATGTKFQFVPYRGGAPAMQDLVAGQVDFMCDFAGNSLPWVRNGQIKPYVVMARRAGLRRRRCRPLRKWAYPVWSWVSGTASGCPRVRPPTSSRSSTARCVQRSPMRPSSSATSTWVRNCRRPSSRRQRRSPRIRKPRSKNGGRSYRRRTSKRNEKLMA